MIDLRFATALQIVLGVALADQNGVRCTSQVLAEGLATNPSFIRKLLVPLARDGVIVTTIGKGGGLHLGRPAGEITLRDIYKSTASGKKILSSRQDIPCVCLVSGNINALFSEIVGDIEVAIYSNLEARTVRDCLARMLEFERMKYFSSPEMSFANTLLG